MTSTAAKTWRLIQPWLLYLSPRSWSVAVRSTMREEMVGRTRTIDVPTPSLPQTPGPRHGYFESYGTFVPPTTESAFKTGRKVRQVKFIPLRQTTGIRKRRASTRYSSLDLAMQAVKKCLDRSRYRAEDIDLVMGCNISKVSPGGREIYFEPTTAIKVRQAFGLKNAICFDVNNACAGMFTGFYIANAMIANGQIRRALIFSGEHISYLTNNAQLEINSLSDSRLACLTLGDGAAAVILDAVEDDNVGIKLFDMNTVSEHSELCIARPSDAGHGGMIMYTASSKLTRAGLSESVNLMVRLIKEKKLSLSSDFRIIGHQVSTSLPPRLVKRVNAQFPQPIISGATRPFDNVSTTGNTASTAHILALARAIAKKNISTHNDVVFLIQASGLTVGLMHHSFEGLPERIRQIKRFGHSRGNIGAVTQGSAARAGPSLTQCPHPVSVKLQSLSVYRDPALGTVELAAAAGRDCLKQNRIPRFLIHCGRYHSGFIEEPSHAALISNRLKLSSSTASDGFFALDVTNGAMGWLSSCYVAGALVQQHPASVILLTAAEPDEGADEISDAGSVRLAAMGSAAMLVAATPGEGFDHFTFRTFDHLATARSVHAAAKPPKPHLVVSERHDYEQLLLEAIQATASEWAQTTGIMLSDIDYFVPPQRSHGFVTTLAQKLGFPSSKVVDGTGDRDCFTSSVPVGLQMLLENRNIPDRARILVVDVASGVQVGIALYTLPSSAPGV